MSQFQGMGCGLYFYLIWINQLPGRSRLRSQLLCNGEFRHYFKGCTGSTCRIKYSANAKWGRTFSIQTYCELKAHHHTQSWLTGFFPNVCLNKFTYTPEETEDVFFKRNTLLNCTLTETQYNNYCGNSCQNVLALIVEGSAIRRNGELTPIYNICITLQHCLAIRALLYDCIKFDIMKTPATMLYSLCVTLWHFGVESQIHESTNQATDSANLSLYLSFEQNMHF